MWEERVSEVVDRLEISQSVNKWKKEEKVRASKTCEHRKAWHLYQQNPKKEKRNKKYLEKLWLKLYQFWHKITNSRNSAKPKKIKKPKPKNIIFKVLKTKYKRKKILKGAREKQFNDYKFLIKNTEDQEEEEWHFHSVEGKQLSTLNSITGENILQMWTWSKDTLRWQKTNITGLQQTCSKGNAKGMSVDGRKMITEENVVYQKWKKSNRKSKYLGNYKRLSLTS